MMMFDVDAPDVRWSTLTEAEAEEAGAEHGHEPYDVDSFARALREGETPGGEDLERVMPRWQVSGRQVEALVDYLKQLSD